jgi:hypothetical protein
MVDVDLEATWTVLAAERAMAEGGISAVPTDVKVRGGRVLAGVDGDGRRRVLVPLSAGEAFAEDRTGTAVHLLRTDHAGTHYLSAVCLRRELDDVFAWFAKEVLVTLGEGDGGAAEVVAALARWRELFSAAPPAALTDSRLVGLLAELLTLEQVLELDPARRVGVWTGPLGAEHDLTAVGDAVEVKATLAREGRLVSISSVDQLDPPQNADLHLVWRRFEPHPEGDSLPEVVDRLLTTGLQVDRFLQLLAAAGYSLADRADYEDRRFRTVEERWYDTASESFPRLTPSSFTGRTVPPGVLRISYQIDLTNEPPVPLTASEAAAVLRRMATTP